MNEALAAAAGEQYVITEEEHATLYDGRSTKQKLNLLTSMKGLPEDRHAAVWQAKQQVTQQLVKATIAHDADIVSALRGIKAAGFPVVVASNCIRESVLALLAAVGVVELVDAIYSNENVKHAKPAGDMYELVARNFGNIAPENVAVFEDSSKGFEAAIRAKCNLFKVSSPRDVRADKVLRRILAFEACSMLEPLVNVVIPMAGNHPTFWTEGPDLRNSELPVVLSNVRGKPALFWTIQSLHPLPKRVHFIFVVRSSIAGSKSWGLPRILPWSVEYSRTSIVAIDKPTRGAAQSVLQARHLIDTDSPLAIFDGNHRLLWPSSSPGLSSLVALLAQCHESAPNAPPHAHDTPPRPGSVDAIVTVFRDRDPRWSYIQHAPGLPTHVVAVKEKMPLSDMACSGLYIFKQGRDFVQAALATHAGSYDGVQPRVRYYIAPVLDTMIAMGKRVRAEILRGSSSIRSFSELKAFEETVFAEVGAQEQQAIYTEMRARNSAKIAQGGFTCDPVLAAESDARRCLAAYVVASAANWIAAPRLERFLHDLPRLFARHVVYQPCGAAGSAARAPLGGRLHWTFLQLVGFGMYEQTKVPGDYLELFETLLWECLSPFEICFDSLILTPSNLVLVGHPTVDVNYVRESVRECMREVGYPVLEPYKSDTLHMTLVRFAGPVTASEQASLEKLVESCEVDPDFNGLLRVNGIAVSPASWKMLASEIPPESVAHIPFPAS